MRLLVSGGGTGGHVYPILSALAGFAEPLTVLYVGRSDGMEQDIVGRTDLPFRGLRMGGGLRGVPPWVAAGNAALMLRAGWEALGVVRDFDPAVTFVTGGFVCVPVVLASWVRRVPVLVYLPDIEPGLAVRFLAHFATRIAATAEASRAYLPAHKVVVTGYPVRPALWTTDRAAARAHWGLEPTDRLLLVFGGSQGAHSINMAVGRDLERLTEAAVVIHVCGRDDEADFAARRAALPAHLQDRYRPYGYLHEMPLALVAADLAVSRAGASALGEYPATGLPSVLIPYPHAGAHQYHNARHMVAAGAAVLLENDELRTQGLWPTVQPLLDDPDRRTTMVQTARALARPEAVSHIGTLLTGLAA
ncbi:MAG: UDP-N-acetylglucosamine--N-acetylmuramyl-(pentapeptide) pyrophosphoryl-undecaprenol N-acetylglucosamine transferase [Chloroflexi bacterium]|nr:UDP-N-acetylglucosamine--N-acetylmuramyl-(pentapeptide) pyrophosphoryl-undecaprenol N-acetylglucosamine transferase [Chloroflexota bacterium]MBU1751624.1 UDP-N-acetylglucosamine--N-acetylmuramyl-(pentapeptide) pyrophosphoryl-undecaprenol N-acetylglucosamine transferase [Chloroflexota bacterium]